MITADSKVTQMINASARIIDARVELYEGSPTVDAFNETLLNVFHKDDHIKEITIERVGEQSKFFGVGICQKLSVTLMDKDREIEIEKDQILEVAFGVDSEFTYPHPLFRVETVSRDETNNDLKIIAYDFLYKAGEHRTSEIEMTSYTIRDYLYACANILGLPVKIALDEADAYVFDTHFSNGANFEGSETIRQALDDIAEATQCIYYVDWDWQLTFKRLKRYSTPEITIDKSKYFSLTNKGERVLATICHATELGDNLYATEGEGVTQYVRDNAFWELRDDTGTLIGNAVSATAGTSMHQINLTWRGNWLLEIGDRFAVVTKDNDTIFCYLLNDTITYNGGYKQVTTWSFTEHTGETASNPITIGDAINKTIARVDKVNKQIELVVSESSNTASAIAQLQLTTGSISANVSRIEENSTNLSNTVEQQMQTLTQQVNAAITPEALSVEISKALDNGVEKVTTSTGFKFDEEGLTVSKSDSDLSTQITEDGMTISRNTTEVLVVDNVGVKATNLHADTYLFIGRNSRFEDYDSGARTGCFWIS